MKSISGEYVSFQGETYYRIANSHLMRDFFISLVSSNDHWMFLSSSGWLTAGRRDADLALFPYYSEDKLSDMRDTTGTLTRLRIESKSGAAIQWRPFWSYLDPQFEITRNLYKTPLGHRIIFEEVNQTLGLRFQYGWSLSNRFGFVRQCQLENIGDQPQDVAIVDGLQNILPYGTERDFQMRYSNLGDAYKKSERITPSQLGVYYCSSIPSDKAEPSEGLRATAVWQFGLEGKVLLSDRQLGTFTTGGTVEPETDQRGCRGAYLVAAELKLEPAETKRWSQVANVGLDQSNVVSLNSCIESGQCIAAVQGDLDASQLELIRLVSCGDGRQLGSDLLRANRHQSNVVFNLMRGGLPVDSYRVPPSDFANHVEKINRDVYVANEQRLNELDADTTANQLMQEMGTLDPDLARIASEYLPLTFSRRHGDPSRPWNAFSIEVTEEDGSPRLNYQGNWRDLFQNWEALAIAYPRFLPSMIFRFVNSSTADGYNPYRVTKDGFEWEVPDPDDPWANIGYWSDHQIIYLLKLLEWSRSFDPDGLNEWLGRDCFVYAQVPYRIKSYEQIKLHPRDTIEYDFELANDIQGRVDRLGSDGKLLQAADGSILRVSLLEKLLVPAIAKMTNLVPGGGIWLNTQRPEWNDANNALVGAGLSVVTVGYLYRWFSFMTDWFQGLPESESFELSGQIADLMVRVCDVLQSHFDLDGMSNAKRLEMVDALSNAGSEFRCRLYESGLSGPRKTVTRSQCLEFFAACSTTLEHTLRANRRDDGLYHSYNLMAHEESGIRVDSLYEMLEGQVAILSSGLLDADESNQVLEALRTSRIYRENQNSYMLYPDRQLTRFLDKNLIPASAVSGSTLLTKMLNAGEHSIVCQDAMGYRFNGDFRNAGDMRNRLNTLAVENAEWADLIIQEKDVLCELFVRTFGHDQFTGRSGTFFGYEGLGSIYWHMVSKLAVATQEALVLAIDNGDSSNAEKLEQHYRDISDGLGVNKTPEHYGGFPTDPYSHSPENSGVRQPGMTGQVKEDILTRFVELGVRINQGILRFDPVMFSTNELLKQPGTFEFIDLNGELTKLELATGDFAFTLCQVPIVYHEGSESRIEVHSKDDDGNDSTETRNEWVLTADESDKLFSRTGNISRVDVHLQSS